jgi:lipopolysaccharide/colanic/teichoic acid biosynthesis glycosyltransferase
LAGVYWLVSFVCALVAFALFNVYGGIARYYSVSDVINLAKAVLISELMTCVLLFTVTRLEGIPRSTPAVHALVLGVGLVTVRWLAHLADKKQNVAKHTGDAGQQHVIIIGVNDLSVLYMKFLEAAGGGRPRVIALLDAEPRWIGRSVNGVRIFGPPSQLESLIREFAVHGVRTDRVVLGVAADVLSEEAVDEIQRVCVRHALDFVSVSQLFGASLSPPNADPVPPEFAVEAYAAASGAVALPRYFHLKRAIDFATALVLIVALLPLWLVIAGLAFVDVGDPILFWQQRIGLNGRNFLLYKIRTLRPAFDRSGQVEPHEQRVSWIGRLLRRTRVDELPQLLNVVVGDMALIGPRPLLPQDQPPVPSVRLMVRPGITGWAQVNGGALLSPEEKKKYDEEYVSKASLRFDLRIVALTALCVIRGDRLVPTPFAERDAGRVRPSDRQEAAYRGATTRFATSVAKPSPEEARVSAARSV